MYCSSRIVYSRYLIEFTLREMATRVPVPAGELLCLNELERKLTDLSEQVALKKEEVRSNFQQFHHLLSVREEFLLKEMDDIVTLARQEVTEKKETLQELYKAREALERELTKNKLKKVLEKNLLVLEAEIGEEVARDMNVCWMELDWKREALEQSVIEVCRVVSLKERPVTRVDYSTKLCPVWSHHGTDSDRISLPRQLAIDDTTQNMLVADNDANRIQIFNGEGNHLYTISTPPQPIGIVLTDEYIFVSTNNKLVLKIEKSSNKSIKSVTTENSVWGIETNSNSDIYVCEILNRSIVVFDKDLKFLKRIKLNSTQVTSNTYTHSIKLYDDNMYVMFSHLYSPPPFHLQIFTLEGELVRCLIKQSKIRRSNFFSIDQLGNIIVTDRVGHQIKIFSKEGEVLHTITSDMLPGDQKFNCPAGVAIDRQNRIIVANRDYKCNLLAF